MTRTCLRRLELRRQIVRREEKGKRGKTKFVVVVVVVVVVRVPILIGQTSCLISVADIISAGSSFTTHSNGHITKKKIEDIIPYF